MRQRDAYNTSSERLLGCCGETSMLRHEGGLAVKESQLITTIERELPDFAKACRS
jgi:hypothetical protein